MLSTKRESAVESSQHQPSTSLPGVDLFDDSPVVVFRWRAAAGWPVVFVSNSVRQFGIEPSDLLTGKLPYSSLVYPDDLPRVGQEVMEYSAAGRVTFEQDYRLVLPNGRTIWIYDFTRVLRDESGQVVFYDGYILDITARKQTEASLHDQVRAVELQRQAILSLSSPIIEVWDGVLALPVVGAVDGDRALHMTRLLLERVTETRCRAVILDLTAVENMDARTTGYLVRIVQALKLLGTQCALCGISAQLAQNITQLQLSLDNVPTVPRLKEALRHFISEPVSREVPRPRRA